MFVQVGRYLINLRKVKYLQVIGTEGVSCSLQVMFNDNRSEYVLESPIAEPLLAKQREIIEEMKAVTR